MFRRLFKHGFWWPARGVKPYAGAIAGAGAGTFPADPPDGALYLRKPDRTPFVFDGRNWLPVRNNAPACGLRLSLSPTDPFPSADQTGKSTIYQMATGMGDQVELYDSASEQWVPRAVPSALSVAVPGTTFRGLDVFDYWNGNSVELKTENWNQVTRSITNVSIATQAVVTTSGAHGFTTGDLVGITDITGTAGTDANRGINGKVFPITVLLSTTFRINADTTALAYTSGGVVWTVPNTRAHNLTKQNGRWVKSGDPAMLYAGSYMTGPTAGQTESSVSKRLEFNWFNQILRELYVTESTDNWTYSTATVRPANNKLLNRVEFFRGIDERPVTAEVYGLTFNDSGAPVAVAQGVGVNSLESFGCRVRGVYADVGTVKSLGARYRGRPSVGYGFLSWLEVSEATPTTFFYGDAGVSFIQCGLTAEVWG